MARLTEAKDLAREQTVALTEIHDKVKGIRSAALKIGELNKQLKSIEADLLDVVEDAGKLTAPNAGLNEMTEQIATVKAMAASQQYELGLAKTSLDKVLPRGVDACGLLLTFAAPAFPAARMAEAGTRNSPTVRKQTSHSQLCSRLRTGACAAGFL
eukprot:TRINITY_DN13545_c0_g1_i3.p1 TRINITY_DN13545_c0_g1~~TRINITY_DN13545_c0_g1_i3.p1  ORF type:complete len:156 (+),score=33.57 TRINITY_DN13545_c0_g1_i3:590-1057(+)